MSDPQFSWKDELQLRAMQYENGKIETPSSSQPTIEQMLEAYDQAWTGIGYFTPELRSTAETELAARNTMLMRTAMNWCERARELHQQRTRLIVALAFSLVSLAVALFWRVG